MAKNLEIITKQFLSYNSKADPSNTDQRFLVAGSKNVLINDQEKFGSRQGFSLFGLAGSTDNGIKGSTEWPNSTGDNFSLRATGTILEVLISNTYETLMESLSSVSLIFDSYWDDTEKIDRLIWCDGSGSLYDWSGAKATLSAITAATLTCGGSSTFGQQRFLTTGTRAVRIKDDNGTWHRSVYTGGEGTTTLTGLATDLTAFPFSGGNLIVQEVITRAISGFSFTNTPKTGYVVDFLQVAQNQLWFGSRSSNKVYVSKNTDITNYTYSSPRAVGEGADFTLDGPGRAFGVIKGDVILFAGTDFIYRTVFNQITVGSSLAETVKVERLKTTARQAALHQNLVCDVGNGLAWIGANNVMYRLDDASLSYNPSLKQISDPIKPDFLSADFTGGHMFFDKTRIYISAPLSALNFIYEFRLTGKTTTTGEEQKEYFWQPPQTMPVNRWAVIGGLIYGHSSATNETYKLFDGYNDNGQAIHAIAILARWNGGVRESVKNISEIFNEGGITANTRLYLSYIFDKDGGVIESINKTIDGLSTDLLYPTAADESLGNLPIGDHSIEGDVTGDTSLQHFRCIDDINVEEFFDYGVTFETNDTDARWEIMCHGSDAYLSSNKPTAIKNN